MNSDSSIGLSTLGKSPVRDFAKLISQALILPSFVRFSTQIMAHKKRHRKNDANTWKVSQEVGKDKSTLKSVAHDGGGRTWRWRTLHTTLARISAAAEEGEGRQRSFAQSPQVNAINDKSCPNSTMSIHDSSGYAGGAAQIPQANTINDKSSPNSTTNIHDSSGYAGGAAQIPLLQVTLEALPKFHR